MKNANKVNVNNLSENNSQINKVSKCLLSLFAVTAISFGSQAFGMKIPQAEKFDVNKIDFNLLILACRNNNIDMVRSFLNDGAKESINKVDSYGKTSLYLACRNNNIEMVKLLLDNGAKESINKVDSNGETSLYWACFNNNLKVVGLLLEHGANVDLAVLKFIQENIIQSKYLEKKAIVTQILSVFIKDKSFDFNKANKESLNIASILGKTLLYWACYNNNQEIVILLLPLCTEETINKADNLGKTPLYWACYNNNLEMVKLLLDSGAKESINKACNFGGTQLYLACMKNNLDMVKLLLKFGAKVDKEALDKAEKNYEDKKTQGVAIQILKELNPTKKYNVTFSSDNVERKRSRSEREKKENSNCGPFFPVCKRTKMDELLVSELLFINDN